MINPNRSLACRPTWAASVAGASRLAPLLATLLASCTVGPNWQAPTAPHPTAFLPAQGTPAPSRTTEAPATPSWWTIFGDPELTSLERRVAAENLDVADATERVMESLAESSEVSAAQYPNANLNASWARERASPNGILGLMGTTTPNDPATVADGGQGFGPAGLPGSDGAPAYSLWQYGIGSSWELDLFGRIRRAVEASRAAVEVSEDERRGVVVGVLAETARDYIGLRGVQAELTITKENLGTAQQSLALTRLRFANGTTTDLDVANAKAAVDTIESRLPVLENHADQLINALSYLTGAPPRTLSAELATAKPLPPIPPSVPVGLPSQLAERRPDIRQAAAALHEATANIGVAEADFYPDISLSGSFDIQALDATGLGFWNSRQYAVGPTISLPLFEGGQLRGQLRLRRAQQKQAAIDYRRTVLKAWQEIDDALTGYNADQNQRARIEDAVAENKVAVATAQAQYAQGAADFLNVLNADDALLASESALVQATTGTGVAIARIYTALGGGWEKTFPASY
jgi:NodT family efflux transporter outer membrane factor (OMF) lipoprotein